MQHENSYSLKNYVTGLAIILLLVLMLPAKSWSQQVQDLQQITDRAIAAGLDRNQIEQIQERAAGRGIDNEMLARLMEPAADLAERGMPSDFMVQKMLEGLAKGVPAGRMMPVIESIHQHTPGAVALSEQWMNRTDVTPFVQSMGGQQSRFRGDLINASLKSLTQEVPSETIESVLVELGNPAVLQKASPQVIAAAVGILPDIPASMLNEAGMQQMISRAVQGGFSAVDIQKLPGAMNAAAKRSQLPSASILNGLSNQIDNGIPANQVLQNLFNGNINAGPPNGIPGRPGGKPGDRPGQGQGNGNGKGNGGFKT
ncbi:hypothetical protein [Rhodohalobacter sp. 8-1]|uniref:hypothetical protein n=1 Tax=Rhodohalobacter sp. 8-1 TaxID=3131972 RepID=UPI0030EC07F8